MKRLNNLVERTNFLQDLGIRVIRFWNKEVDDNISLVIEKIKTEFNLPLPRGRCSKSGGGE